MLNNGNVHINKRRSFSNIIFRMRHSSRSYQLIMAHFWKIGLRLALIGEFGWKNYSKLKTPKKNVIRPFISKKLTFILTYKDKVYQCFLLCLGPKFESIQRNFLFNFLFNYIIEQFYYYFWLSFFLLSEQDYRFA